MEVIELPNPPLPPIHRLSTNCDRHPNERFTGFCTSCLRERLAGLESTTSTTHRNSTSTISSSLKSIFFRPQAGQTSSSSSSSSLHPELRRCKSFSCGRDEGFTGPHRISTSFEPQRKSCDVRGRNTLWSLFHQDDNHRAAANTTSLSTSSLSAAAAVLPVPVIESHVEEIEEEEEDDEDEEIGPVLAEETFFGAEINNVGFGVGEKEVEEEEEEEEEEMGMKPMKDHIDLESNAKKAPTKDFKEIAGSFWLAASVFSKKLQKWRRKQKLKKMKKEEEEEEERGKPGPKSSSSRRFRDTQSELAFGRRSCDTDPRFSLDAGRISFDDPRYSLDEPRASWDGYLIGAGAGAGTGTGTVGGGGGGRSLFPRHLPPPMLSVVEDAPTPTLFVQRSDGQIPVEEDLNSTVPGGSSQTKDYYSDSSSSRSRRRSLDRSNSVRKVSVEMNEQNLLPPMANARVSPANVAYFRDWSSNSLRSDRSESFETAYREPPHKLPPRSKSKRWSKAWSIWGFIHRRSTGRGGGGGGGGGVGGGGANVVDRSFSESWPELRANGYANSKILRSNSSRSSQYGNSSFGSSMRRNGLETNGIGKKKREEFVLERNRSACRYSPGHVDNNGMLRFYLTPMRRRGLGKNVHNSSSYQSFTRSVLRLY